MQQVGKLWLHQGKLGLQRWTTFSEIVLLAAGSLNIPGLAGRDSAGSLICMHIDGDISLFLGMNGRERDKHSPYVA